MKYLLIASLSMLGIAAFLVGILVGTVLKQPECYSEIHYELANVLTNTDEGVTIYFAKGEYYADGKRLLAIVREKNHISFKGKK